MWYACADCQARSCFSHREEHRRAALRCPKCGSLFVDPVASSPAPRPRKRNRTGFWRRMHMAYLRRKR